MSTYEESPMYEPSVSGLAGGSPGSGPSGLDVAHDACSGDMQALYETVHMLRERLRPVLRDETEDRLAVLADGVLRQSGESAAVCFVREQQERARSMRATLDDVLSRLDV